MYNLDPIRNNISSLLHKRSTLYYVGGAIFIVILVIVSLLMLRPKQSGKAKEPSDKTPQKLVTFPKPAFQTWNGGTIAPVNLVEETQIYTLKTDFGMADLQRVAQKLDLSGPPTIKNANAIIKAETEKGEINRLIFNLESGIFTYISSSGIPLNSSEAITAEQVEAFIKNFYPNDPALTFHSIYKRKSTGENLTYYVFYRDWNKTSSKKMPIFSPIGLLNLTDANLSDININSTLSLPRDPDVYATTDNTDGYARADQFNAITVTVATKDDQDRIQSINSTIRPLKPSVAKFGTVIPYDQAVLALKSNKSEFFLITPEDKKAASWDKIFPENVAKADVGEIQESYMAYLEYPSSIPQAAIRPYFIFKGKALLKNGHSTRFIAAVSATDESQGDSLGVSSYQKTGTQSQGTYAITPAPTAGPCGLNITCPTPTVTPRPPTATPTPHCGLNITCPTPTVTPRPPTPTPGCGFNCPTPTPPPPTPTPGCGFNCPTPTPPPPSPTPGCTPWWTCYTPPSPTPPPGCPPACPSPSPTPPARPSPTPFINENCVPRVTQLDRDATYPSVGIWSPVGVVDDPPGPPPPVITFVGDNWWYYIPTPGDPPTQAEINELYTNGPLINPERESPEDVFQQAQYDTCPIKAAYHTPSIFLYGTPDTVISLSPSSVTKNSPKLSTQDRWIATIASNGFIDVNSLPYRYLYYEYSNVKFSAPREGWVVKKAKLSEFESKVSTDLNLSAIEKDRLTYELATSTSKIDQEDLYIGLIPQVEVEKKLPLTVSPEPTHLTRLHFYVSSLKLKPKSITKPQLKPVKKSGTALFEVGSYADIQ